MNQPSEQPRLNACTWQPSQVTLVDGRQVPSDSPEWLAETEARHMLRFPVAAVRGDTSETRKMALERIGQRRGPEAAAALQERMDAIEPHYVLSLPNRAQRNRYVDAIRYVYGENTAEHLRNRVIALHKSRAESDGGTPSQ